MKKVIMSAVVSMAALVFVTPSFASCVESTSCFSQFSAVSIGGSANFGGYGTGVFNGEDGGIKVEKNGWGGTELVMEVGGNLCGVNCQSGSFGFKATAGERVDVMGGALGTTSGETVGVYNEGGAYGNATFSFMKGLSGSQ